MRAAVKIDEMLAENDASELDEGGGEGGRGVGGRGAGGRGAGGRRLEVLYQRVIEAAVARDLHALRTHVADIAGEPAERSELTEMQFLFGDYE